MTRPADLAPFLPLSPARLAALLGRTTRTTDGCLEWTGRRNIAGYGVTKLANGRSGGQTVAVHRLIYSVLVAPVDPSLDLDHTCGNRSCCDVDHLEPVTPAENNRRAGLRSRAKRETCGNGHPWTERNTLHVRGTRQCRECSLDAKRRYRAKALA